MVVTLEKNKISLTDEINKGFAVEKIIKEIKGEEKLMEEKKLEETKIKIFLPEHYLNFIIKEGYRVLFIPKSIGATFTELHAKGFNRSAILDTLDIVVTTHPEYGIWKIVEILGEDPKDKSTLTNECFRYNPNDDKYEFSGKSYAFELMMIKYNLSKEQFIEKMRKFVKEWNEKHYGPKK